MAASLEYDEGTIQRFVNAIMRWPRPFSREQVLDWVRAAASTGILEVNTNSGHVYANAYCPVCSRRIECTLGEQISHSCRADLLIILGRLPDWQARVVEAPIRLALPERELGCTAPDCTQLTSARCPMCNEPRCLRHLYLVIAMPSGQPVGPVCANCRSAAIFGSKQ